MKKITKGFTLIELLITIAIISILAIGASKINFNPQIDKQKAQTFSNEIFTNLETIRNNSLLGKGVGPQLIHPEKWILSLNSLNNGNLQTKYQTGGILYDYQDLKVNFDKNSKISQIKCFDLKNENSKTIQNLDIELNGQNMSFSGCDNIHKIVEITTNYKKFETKIKLNSITGLIEKK